MEQVKVSELATEFEIRNRLVIDELKKIGVWVPSSDTQVDLDIANRIRRRLQLLAEFEQEEQARAERVKERKKKVTAHKVRKSIKQLGRPRKTVKKVEETPAESPLATPAKPRRSKVVYRRVERADKPAPEEIPEAEFEPTPEAITLADDLSTTMSVTETTAVAEEIPAGVVPGATAEAGAAPTTETPASPTTPEAAAAGIAGTTPEAKAAAPKAAASAAAAGVPPSAVRPPGAPGVTARPRPGAARIVRPRPVPRRPGVTRTPVPVQPPVAVQPKTKKVPKVLKPRDLTLPETLTVKEFSEKIGIKTKDVLRDLLTSGVMATINQSLDKDVMEAICTKFKITPTFVTFEESVIEEGQEKDSPEELKPRPPVVTVMGHVDHGKTSLLDSIRKTRVAAGEAGGITQHIGAYHVDVKDHRIVFLDTPGHEAFTMMRARGAQTTDIVVLVVAADDGVMPQTREAIDHSKAAGVPILVAINKIDKVDAQPERVKQELSDLGLIPEDWGGDTVMVEVSATEGTNLDSLLEMILLVAEVQELKANPDRPASGTVLEAKLDRGRGAVATVIVQNGTIRSGDYFIAGSVSGKIRALFDDRGKAIKESGPSSAVEVLGIQGMPQAGDTFQVVPDAAKARQVVEYRKSKEHERGKATGAKLSLDELYAQMKAGEVKELPIIVKADALGSAEVVGDMLSKVGTEEVRVNIIQAGVGAINESDVIFASASNAVIIGFNVRPEKAAQDSAEREGVDIRLHTVIYDIKEEVESALVGLLDPTFQEVYQGRAEVRDTFRVPKYGVIAGCHVLDGTIARNFEVRLLRDNVVIHEGKIDSLRRFKEDVNSVRSGYECGISFAGFSDVKLGDVIEAYTQEEAVRKLN